MQRSVLSFDSSRAIALGFHNVSEVGFASQAKTGFCRSRYTLSREKFRQHLAAIKARVGGHGVQLVNEAVAERGSSIYLTFDDGRESAYTCIADDLESLDLRGHFFVVSDWIDRSGFMNPRQIRDLRRRGHVIGSHTQTHPARMSNLQWTDLLREWWTSCTVLNDLLGERVEAGSVANGYYARRVARAAAASGLKTLFTSEPTITIRVVEGCRVFGRYSITANMAPETSAAIAARCILPRWRQSMAWKIRKAAKVVGGNAYLRLREKVLTRI